MRLLRRGGDMYVILGLGIRKTEIRKQKKSNMKWKLSVS